LLSTPEASLGSTNSPCCWIGPKYFTAWLSQRPWQANTLCMISPHRRGSSVHFQGAHLHDFPMFSALLFFSFFLFLSLWSGKHNQVLAAFIS
jgi:hypothetical protein